MIQGSFKKLIEVHSFLPGQRVFGWGDDDDLIFFVLS